MTTTDASGRQRRAVYLPEECWDWLEATAERDGTSRSDLLEGLVLLAMDEAEERQAFAATAAAGPLAEVRDSTGRVIYRIMADGTHRPGPGD